MHKKIGLATAALALGAFAFVSPASAAEATVKVGVLTCHVASGWGFVFGSSKDLRCVYDPDRGGNERYYGTINKYGVDIGYTEGGVIVWAVFAPSSTLKPGALGGDYVGASASATVAVGVGANVLLGGFRHSITLQPISIEGNTGLNVAAGIGALTLRHDRG
ncbi:MAG: DUF992 domain-containing protein [Alphaproteobacteria bacterium]